MKHRMKSVQGQIKLTSILAEIKRSERRLITQFQRTAANSISIKEIINSNGLSAEQTLALKKFFEHYNNGKIPVLNEFTVKKIDNRISQSILSEGFFDWVKSVGSKAKEWLTSGWENVKKVWGNFKDIVSNVIEKFKDLFKKIAAATYEKIESLKSTLTKSIQSTAEESIEFIKQQTPDQVKTEIKTLKDCVNTLLAKSQAIISGTGWEEKLKSGNIEPTSDVKTESIYQRPKLVFDKFLVETLLTLESGGTFHFEDVFDKDKFPILHNLVIWICKGLVWVFSPINSVIKWSLNKLLTGGKKDGSSGILVWINSLAEKFGGPKVIFYPVLGFLCTELAEIVLGATDLDTHRTAHLVGAGLEKLGIEDMVIKFIEQYVPVAGTVITILEYVFIGYAVANFILTIVPEISKMIKTAVDKTSSIQDVPPGMLQSFAAYK